MVIWTYTTANLVLGSYKLTAAEAISAAGIVDYPELKSTDALLRVF